MNMDVGWLPSSMRHWFHMVRMSDSMLLLDDSRLTKRMLNYDYAQGNNDNWSSEVKYIYDRIVMTDSYSRHVFSQTKIAFLLR